MIIPEEQAITPFFKNRRNMQMKYIQEIRERFNEAEILKVPLFDREIKGLKMLTEISQILFSKEDAR